MVDVRAIGGDSRMRVAILAFLAGVIVALPLGYCAAKPITSDAVSIEAAEILVAAVKRQQERN